MGISPSVFLVRFFFNLQAACFAISISDGLCRGIHQGVRLWHEESRRDRNGQCLGGRRRRVSAVLDEFSRRYYAQFLCHMSNNLFSAQHSRLSWLSDNVVHKSSVRAACTCPHPAWVGRVAYAPPLHTIEMRRARFRCVLTHVRIIFLIFLHQ